MTRVKITDETGAPLAEKTQRAIEHADAAVAKRLSRLNERFDLVNEWVVNGGAAKLRVVSNGRTPASIETAPIAISRLTDEDAVNEAAGRIRNAVSRALLESLQTRTRTSREAFRRKRMELEAISAVEA